MCTKNHNHMTYGSMMEWSATDRIFCHYHLFFALLPPYGPRKSKFWKNEKHTWRHYPFTNAYHKWQSYDKWFFRYRMQQTKCFVISGLTAQKIKVKKKKKTPGDITILHMCSKKFDQMMYASWDMVHDRCNYFSFWAIFCLFTPITSQKIKILKTWKNSWRYIHFIYVYQKLWSDDVRFLRYVARQMLLLFLILGYFLPFYPPNSLKNQNFEKMKKTPEDIIILHTCTKNYNQMMYTSWYMGRDICNYSSFWAIFYLFTPITAQKIKILKKRKNLLEIP